MIKRGKDNTRYENTAIEMKQQHLLIAAGEMIGSEWQPSKSYAVGDIVMHNNKYYKCKTTS